MIDAAREHNLVTQMGTQIHAGENYRRVVELVQSGAIGPVRDVEQLRLWCRSIGRDPIWGTLGPQIVQVIYCRSLITRLDLLEDLEPGTLWGQFD